jgi:hypothetical protein
MTLSCLVEEDDHTRRLEVSDFPLALGGRDADVEVPGLAGEEPAAFLALHDGELFAQPRGHVSLSIGGRPITASQWLRDGDEVRLLGTRIRVVWRADRKSLQIRHLPLEPRAEPPMLVVPAAYERPAEGDALVHPADYRPRPLPLDARPRAVRRLPLRAMALALITLLAVASSSPRARSRCAWSRRRSACPCADCPTSGGTGRACSCPATTPSGRSARATARSRRGWR